jgi:hypothetical protein
MFGDLGKKWMLQLLNGKREYVGQLMKSAIQIQRKSLAEATEDVCLANILIMMKWMPYVRAN